MLSCALFVAVLGLLAVSAGPASAQEGKPASVHPLQVTDIEGRSIDLARYKGKVLLLVNVASECGYTPQYEGLQNLHRKFGKDGLVILAFPSNDFGAQEPGSAAQIKEFARKNYGVQFELFSKVRITGKDACPLYQHLTGKTTNPTCAGAVRWNFEKFLIGRDGRVIARFASNVEPESADLVEPLRQALTK